MFPIFSCSINVTVTSQNDIPYFHMNQTVYICKCFIHLNLSHCNVVYCVDVVENVDRRTKMKIDSTWTSILRQIDVDLMSVCNKKYCVQKYNSGKIVCGLRLKSNLA